EAWLTVLFSSPALLADFTDTLIFGQAVDLGLSSRHLLKQQQLSGIDGGLDMVYEPGLHVFEILVFIGTHRPRAVYRLFDGSANILSIAVNDLPVDIHMPDLVIEDRIAADRVVALLAGNVNSRRQ